MSNVKTLQGQTTVCNSSQIKDFKQTKDYPLAWEIIFLNDKTGTEFALNTQKAFRDLPKQQGYIIGFSDDHTAPIRCLNCVFKNKDAFRKILNDTLKGITIFDEITEKLIPKTSIIKDADKALNIKLAIAI